jgi:hypothetical protein
VALWNVGSRTRSFAFGIIAVVTLFVALWVGLGNGLHKNYVTPTPVRIFRFSHCFVLLPTFFFSGQYWCWIGRNYEGQRLAGEYIWLWITCFTSIILNVSVYFWTKGHLEVNLKGLLL